MPESAAHNQTRHRSISFLRRVYALVPIVLVLFLSFQAMRYLVNQLLVPVEPPAQVAAIPARVTEEVWRTDPAEFLGMRAAEHPRMPLAHYHHIEGWFQPDSVNDCTRSGCHPPMPHARRKEVRAFLNMHATSIHCGVCHLEHEGDPRPLVWYDLDDGHPVEPPALLRVSELLTSGDSALDWDQPTAAMQEQLARLLRMSAEEAGGDPSLHHLAEIVAGPAPTSPQFMEAVAEVRARLPLHFRGEYGSKLALRAAGSDQPILAHPDSRAAVRQFLELGDDAEPARRAELIDKVHTARRSEPLVCHECHRAADRVIDLGGAGYPPSRIDALHDRWIFTAIEDISSGQRLRLPGFISPSEDAEPTSP